MSKRPSTKERVYEDLRRRILSGDLESDTPLTERELAERYNVSRTPVREALRLLESEQLVRSIPNVGSFVGGLSWSDARETFYIREVLEAYAAQLTVNRLTKIQLDEISSMLEDQRVAIQNQDVDAYIRSDSKFHSILNNNCGNRTLIELINRLNDQTKIFILIRKSFETPENLENSLQEHTEIISAIKDRNPDAVSRAVWQHGHRFFSGIGSNTEDYFPSPINR